MSDHPSPSNVSPATTAPQLRRIEVLVIVLFLAVNVLVPVAWGDIFPFTSSPMFCDAPRAYCVYRVLTPTGDSIPAEEVLLQRIYDGNPPGYGVGITPPATLARFGEVASEEEIREHVSRFLAERQEMPHVVVEQDVIGCNEGQCRVLKTNRFTVERP